MHENTVLLLKKLLVTFIVAFLGPFMVFVMGAFSAPNFSFDKSAWVSALTGAFAMGIRAILALGPFNLVPSDAQHSIIVTKAPPAA